MLVQHGRGVRHLRRPRHLLRRFHRSSAWRAGFRLTGNSFARSGPGLADHLRDAAPGSNAGCFAMFTARRALSLITVEGRTLSSWTEQRSTELFDAVGSPIAIACGSRIWCAAGREGTDRNVLPLHRHALESACAMHYVPSPFGLGSIAPPGVNAEELVARWVHVLARAMFIHLIADVHNDPAQRADNILNGPPPQSGTMPT